MRELADISGFMALQNNANSAMVSEMAVFNGKWADKLKAKIHRFSDLDDVDERMLNDIILPRLASDMAWALLEDEGNVLHGMSLDALQNLIYEESSSVIDELDDTLPNGLPNKVTNMWKLIDELSLYISRRGREYKMVREGVDAPDEGKLEMNPFKLNEPGENISVSKY